MEQPGGEPLLVLDRVGEGRVALLLSDQIWLWSRGHDGGGPQAELLRRVAHWLMQEPELEENALTARVEDGRPPGAAPHHRSRPARPSHRHRPGRQDATTLALTEVSPRPRHRRACRPTSPASGRLGWPAQRLSPPPPPPTRRKSPICAPTATALRQSGRRPAAGFTGSATARPAETCRTLRAHRAGPGRIRQRLDRAAAHGRPYGDRHRRPAAAAALAGAAADARASRAGLAAGGRLRHLPTRRYRAYMPLIRNPV